MNEELKVIITAEIDELKKNTEEAKKQINGVGNTTNDTSGKMVKALSKIGKAIAAAFSVKAIINFTKEIVNCAAEVAAEQSAFSQIMGDYSDEATAKLRAVADETGIVETRLTSSMTSMTAKWKGLGYGIEDATTLATRGLTLAADAAAFWDMSLDESTGHLNSFINGSYEGGEAIGLFANDTQMALFAVEQGLVETTKEWANLDEATKQATRLEYAENMLKASGAIGQAAKESGQYANVQANLTEKWRQFKAEIGTPILKNVVIPAMKALSAAVDAASAGYQSLKGFVSDVKDKMQEATDFCEQHAAALEIVGAAIAVVTAAIIAYTAAQAIKNAGGIVEIAQLAATAIGYYALAAAQAVATAASAAFGAVMAFITSPITLVVLAIAALIAAIVLCVKHWDEIKAKVKEVAEKMAAWVSEAKDKVTEKFNEMKEKISEKVSQIKENVVNKFNEVKAGMSEKVAAAKEAVVNKFNEIKSGISEKVSGAKEAVSTGFSEMKSAATEKVSAIVSSVSGKFSEIKSSITDKINGARDAVKGAIDKMKSFFNFSWSLPKIKMPHISVSGKFSLSPASAPKFSISWYKLGGVFDKTTLFPFGGSVGGLGEDGAEAIVPLEKNTKWLDRLASMLNEKQGGGVPIILQVDGKTLAEVTVDSINNLTRQTGSLPLRLA